MPDRPTPQPPGAMPPMVSIHVPICAASPDRVRATLSALALLDYPAFEVVVVDHDTSDPQSWEPVARHCARLDARFQFFHLGPSSGGQAGALNFARTRSAGRAEFIAVLDAGVLVPRDWLRCVMPGFADPRVGAVGSPCIVRKEALDGVGGWAEWCVDEAAALDLALLRRGWRLARCPRPVDRNAVGLAAYRRQVARLAYGAAQVGRRNWRPLFSPFDHELTLRQRCAVVAGWTPWIADALSLPAHLLALVLCLGFAGAFPRSMAPMLLCMAPSVGLIALRLARIPGAGIGAAAMDLASSHAVAEAIWRGVSGRPPPSRDTVRRELALLMLTVAALSTLAHAGIATWQARLWCAILLAQSLPYAAAVSVAALAALPAWQPWRLRMGLRPVARTGAAD